MTRRLILAVPVLVVTLTALTLPAAPPAALPLDQVQRVQDRGNPRDRGFRYVVYPLIAYRYSVYQVPYDRFPRYSWYDYYRYRSDYYRYQTYYYRYNVPGYDRYRYQMYDNYRWRRYRYRPYYD